MVGAVGAGVSPGIATAGVGGTGSTVLDLVLTRAASGMRTRHGLFRDSNGDSRYSILLSSAQSKKIPCNSCLICSPLSLFFLSLLPPSLYPRDTSRNPPGRQFGTMYKAQLMYQHNCAGER